MDACLLHRQIAVVRQCDNMVQPATQTGAILEGQFIEAGKKCDRVKHS